MGFGRGYDTKLLAELTPRCEFDGIGCLDYLHWLKMGITQPESRTWGWWWVEWRIYKGWPGNGGKFCRFKITSQVYIFFCLISPYRVIRF